MISKERIIARFQAVQDQICDFIVRENGAGFREDQWNYGPGENRGHGSLGGGRSRIFEGGRWMEKGGVNFSAIEGTSLPPSAASAFSIAPNTPFFACGVSLVLHPRNPHVPTVHLNIRYFAAGQDGALSWFGGGMDLTPYYPRREAVVAWHRGLRTLCERHGRDYEAMKKACDEYFFIKHRNEARGVGGLFFDHLRGNAEADFAFTAAVGEAFPALYAPCLAYRDAEYDANQKDFQLMRRGRYVEFNLVYDRGTIFGLQSQGRIESILMSLPPLAAWVYDYKAPTGSREAELTDYWLKPRDWANDQV